MHLQLSRPAARFQDGSAGWNASAADALAIWNQHLDLVHFAPAAAVSAAGGDRMNCVFFANTIYGQTFGPYVLAITMNYSGPGSTFTETDVIFNNKQQWNSYRGPIHGFFPNQTFDFHRVALHEFGHVLGLGHPDQEGQGVSALMNSIITDLDHLLPDDIAGARSLYGAQITSLLNPPAVRSGEQFSYQILTNNKPLSYSAVGLPPGLQFNSATGLITGKSNSSGAFTVDVVVPGNFGTASGKVRIVIIPLPLTSGLSPPAVLIGDKFSYQAAAGNNPTVFSAAGLPAGLRIDPRTGIISGAATVSGVFNVTIKASGPSSEASGIVRIVISPPRITSAIRPPAVDIGSNFAYQITADHRPTLFAATGLPAGLRIDSATGRIFGIPTLSGVYPVRITARGAVGEAASTVYIAVRALETFDLPTAQIPLSRWRMVADPIRPRIYVAGVNKIIALDSTSFAIVAEIPISDGAADLSVSADGTKLFIAGSGSPKINVIDLDTLTALPALTTNQVPAHVLQAANGILYLTEAGTNGVFQVDPVSGATLNHFAFDSINSNPDSIMEMSSDRKTLFVLQSGSAPSLFKYDISNGASPTLVQSVQTTDPLTLGRDLVVTPDGKLLAVLIDHGNPGFYSTILRSTADLTVVKASLSPSSGGAADIAFSLDSSLAFVSMSFPAKIEIFGVANSKRIRTINLPENARPLGLAIDSLNANVFVVVDLTSRLFLYAYPAIPSPDPPPPHSLLNVSTRLRAQSGENVLIGGFIIRGTEPKKVLLRAIGPSLPVAGKLADPLLDLHDSTEVLIARDDNWNSHRTTVLATGAAPNDEHEATIVTALSPGNYTAIVRGLSNTTGVALVELYDLEPGKSRIANISTRGKVETGDNVMIGGFIIGGNQPTKVIVRAIGPSLAARGVDGALADTTLSLHNGNGVKFAENDDWKSDQAGEIIASTIPPDDPREAAIVRTLTPGNYTAIVHGKNETTGVALVEVYNLEQN